MKAVRIKVAKIIIRMSLPRVYLWAAIANSFPIKFGSEQIYYIRYRIN